MNRSVAEAGKTALIIVLILSLLFLFAAALPADAIRSTPWLSTVLQPIAPLLGLPTAELTHMSVTASVSSAAQPLCISIRNNSGRYTAQWDLLLLNNAYETLGQMLGQALETAEPLSQVPQTDLFSALAAPSVCFDYGFTLPVSLASAWLDASFTQEAPDSSRYILSLQQNRVFLYLQGSTCRKAETQVSPDEFSALLQLFEDDGSQFAFEAQSHLASLSIIPADAPLVQSAQFYSLCGSRYVEYLAGAFGFNPYDENRYMDGSAVAHFSEAGGSLQIGVAGDVYLTTTSDRISAQGDSLEQLVEKARSLLSLAADSSITGADLYLSGVTQAENQTVCTFEYVMEGIPVRWSDGPAAEVTFSGKTVTSLHVKAFSFTTTGLEQYLLPPLQTAAILPTNSALQLQYHPTPNGDMSVGWVK